MGHCQIESNIGDLGQGLYNLRSQGRKKENIKKQKCRDENKLKNINKTLLFHIKGRLRIH